MTAYRGEEARLQRKVEELEAELASARARLARVEGRSAGPRSLPRVLLGAEAAVSAGRTVAGRLDDAAVSALLASLSRRYGVTGQVTRTERGWTWVGASPSGRMADVQAVERRGRVRFVVRERLHGVMGAAYGGIVGGIGGGAAFLAGLAAGAAGVPTVVGVVAWLLSAALAARLVVARVARRRLAQVESLADDLAACFGPRRGTGARIAQAVGAPDLASTTAGALEVEREAAAEAEAAGAERAAARKARPKTPRSPG